MIGGDKDIIWVADPVVELNAYCVQFVVNARESQNYWIVPELQRILSLAYLLRQIAVSRSICEN